MDHADIWKFITKGRLQRQTLQLEMAEVVIQLQVGTSNIAAKSRGILRKMECRTNVSLDGHGDLMLLRESRPYAKPCEKLGPESFPFFRASTDHRFNQWGIRFINATRQQ